MTDLMQHIWYLIQHLLIGLRAKKSPGLPWFYQFRMSQTVL